MPQPSETILRSETLDKLVLDYTMAAYFTCRGWWSGILAGSSRITRVQHFMELRKRYEGRRSVSSLDSDIKDKPFPRSANVPVPAEQIFGEFLIPTFLANTIDLEPALQVQDLETEAIDEARTTFHDRYHRDLHTRALREYSTRDLLTVGSSYHKWTYETVWTQVESRATVWASPKTQQPALTLDPATGRGMPRLADPKTPEALRPRDALSGEPLRILEVPSVQPVLEREGPNFVVRRAEEVLFPPHTVEPDPQKWEYAIDTFDVSPWWFVGREGDPWDGKLKNLDRLWRWMGLKPEELYRKPKDAMAKKIKLAEYHGPFAVTASGKPAEIIALLVPEANLLLGWRLTPFPRRPFFNRQVWHRGDAPLGKGIPESLFGFRNALDASLNQDLDAGNLYNHPPTLMSDLAILDNEEYELAGPGTRWIVRDINGVRVLAQPPATRDPIERENWLFGMAQRIWGVTDLNLNAPTSSLSPNISTAHGVQAVLSQGNLKFGHLTKRLAEVDSQEYQFVHDLFRSMLANPKTISVNGKPQTIEPSKREEFFSARYRVVAVGNGVSTNPMVRVQMLGSVYDRLLASRNPFVLNDPALFKAMTQDYVAAAGLSYQLKDLPALQAAQELALLLQQPTAAAILGPAIQQAVAAVTSAQPAPGLPGLAAAGAPTNGRQPGPLPGPLPGPGPAGRVP